MKLPNVQQADLGSKLEEYSLNLLHREGQHKARVFLSALGISLDNVDLLRDAILQAAHISDDVETRGDIGFGDIYVLRFTMQTKVGAALVLTAWIIRQDEDFPRLTTCYILST